MLMLETYYRNRRRTLLIMDTRNTKWLKQDQGLIPRTINDELDKKIWNELSNLDNSTECYMEGKKERYNEEYDECGNAQFQIFDMAGNGIT